jgi:hypothetical protein
MSEDRLDAETATRDRDPGIEDSPDIFFTLGAEFAPATRAAPSRPPEVRPRTGVSAAGADGAATGSAMTAGANIVVGAVDPGVRVNADAAVGVGDTAEVYALQDIPPPDYLADIRVYAHEVAHDIADLLLVDAPPDWARLEMACSVTIAAAVAEVEFSTAAGDSVRVEVTSAVIELVRLLRTVTIPLQDRAWWRIMLWCTISGEFDVEFDYGERPFPVGQLLPAAAYRADLEEFPHERIPVWLGAYLAAAARRIPSPGSRAGTARAVDLPDPALIWARWATVAAAAVAIGTPWGPRILGSTAAFESTNGSGSTLHLLPRDRVVLSGGLWSDPALDAVYNDDADPPEYLAGAPDWVDMAVLNPRAQGGLLSFCYWWNGAAWYSGESPAPVAIGAAIPGLWTADTVTEVVCRVLGASARRNAVADLVAAAQDDLVTRAVVAAAFDLDEETDLAGAYAQLAMAGLTA